MVNEAVTRLFGPIDNSVDLDNQRDDGETLLGNRMQRLASGT
jgi:hypothetical protein